MSVMLWNGYLWLMSGVFTYSVQYSGFETEKMLARQFARLHRVFEQSDMGHQEPCLASLKNV